MKKNLAKQITLGIVIGTMLMGSGTVYADRIGLGGGSVSEGVDAIAIGTSITKADDSIVIGSGTESSSIEIGGKNSVAIGADTAIGISNNVTDGAGGVALGAKTRVHGTNSVALGYGSYVGNENNVVSVGSGTSYNVGGTETRRIINVSDGINDNDAATVGQMERYVDDALANVSGGSVDMSDYYTKTEADERYVKITTNEGGFSVQPTIVIDDAGQMVFGSNSSWIDGDGEGFYAGRIDTNEGHTADNAKAAMTSDGQVIAQEFILKNGTTQINVKDELDNKANKATTLAGYGIADAYTKDDVDTKLDTKADAATEDARHAMFIATATDLDARITAEATARQNAIAQEAITRDAADTRLQSQIDTKADAATEDARHATFIATATDLDARITAEATARQNAVAQESLARWQEDLRLESGIQQNASAIAGLNQTVTRLDGRLDKVGAGAAALAALHPLDYDAENKLSFAAGLGNYGGETAGAVGAFYRPNENVMFSIGGTAGNGENMVNLGASFAIGKGSSGMAKLSKAELVTAIKDVKAENSELRHEINNAKAENQKLQERIAKLEEMVLKLAGK